MRLHSQNKKYREKGVGALSYNVVLEIRMPFLAGSNGYIFVILNLLALLIAFMEN